MTKIRAEIEVPNDEYCESADNVCPMCLEGNWGKCENFGEDVCHCLELVPVEETTCPYYKKNEAEE